MAEVLSSHDFLFIDTCLIVTLLLEWKYLQSVLIFSALFCFYFHLFLCCVLVVPTPEAERVEKSKLTRIKSRYNSDDSRVPKDKFTASFTCFTPCLNAMDYRRDFKNRTKYWHSANET